jgi:hypothetical protein
VQVVPDESRLGSGVIAMAPFEVVTGSHPADLHSGQRRFFQYLYRIRLINPDSIGKDVPIPDIQIHYRVNSKIAANMALQGRDLVYVLPPMSVRVASMVPSGAADIRDAGGEPFTTAEALDFRAGVLEIVGIALVALGALMTLLVLVRLARGRRGRTPAGERQLEAGTLVGLAARELGDVQHERERQGWNPALIHRALAATRVAAAGAIGRPINQRTTDDTVEGGEGRLMTRGPGGGTRRAVSAAVTASDLAREIARLRPGAARTSLLEQLRTALVTFTTAAYGRDGVLDDTSLDSALTSAVDAARAVKSEHAWPRRMRRRGGVPGPALETQA